MDDELRHLAERQAIVDVLATYCARLDEYDIDAVAAAFTEDCVTDYGNTTMSGGGAVHGREAFHARISRSQSSWRRTHHQLGQILVDVDGEQASSLAYATAWHERWDGSIDLLFLRYVDRLQKTEGRWLIAHRRMEVSAFTGFEGFNWHMVGRQMPAEKRVPQV